MALYVVVRVSLSQPHVLPGMDFVSGTHSGSVDDCGEISVEFLDHLVLFVT